MLRARIIRENYIINLFSGHMPHHIPQRMTESKLYLSNKIMIHAFTDKYPQQCVFLYNFNSPHVSLFSRKLNASSSKYARVLALNTM